MFGIIYAIGNTFTFKGYRYNDASVESPIENTANGFCLIIMIILFAFMGNVSSIWEILTAYELIGIICIFLGIGLLGVVQHRISKAKGQKELFKSGASALIFPILFCLQ
ncbi:MAG: hypothetical protein ACI4J1_04880 [Ruminiclostridium sp.]